VDPISCIGNYKIKWLGAIGPTQSGKSVVLQAAVADMVDQDPGPGLYVLPDETTGKKHLDEKVISMIKASPELSLYCTGNKRDMSYESVRLQHMTIYPAWATSIVTMNSFPMKRVFLDEVRLMGLTIGNESNAIKLASDRLTTYFGYGIGQGYMVSSPSTEGDLLHQQLTVPGTLYLSWQVQCQECFEYQELDFFVNIIFNEKTKKPECRCAHCGAIFSDVDRKKEMNSHGKYAVVKFENGIRMPTQIRKDGTLEVPYELGVGHNRVFFHWSSMESPFRSFDDIWKEFIQTKDKVHDYKNFWQAWLSRFWVEDKSKASVKSLSEHKKSYRLGHVPDKVKILTAGIDTQDKGFYVVVRGFGENQFTCVVDAFHIPCHMAIAEDTEIERLFNETIFNRIFESGWKVSIAAIDTGGHRTKQLYRACTKMSRLILCKGATEAQVTPINYSKEVGIYLVRTPEYLEELDHRSQSNDYWLPENISKDYLVQWTNRRKTENQNKKTGETLIIWKKMGQDDYRYADVHSLLCLDIPTDKWANLRQRLNDPDFISNPYLEEKAMEQIEKLETVKPIIEQEVDYSISGFNW